MGTIKWFFYGFLLHRLSSIPLLQTERRSPYRSKSDFTALAIQIPTKILSFMDGRFKQRDKHKTDFKLESKIVLILWFEDERRSNVEAHGERRFCFWRNQKFKKKVEFNVRNSSGNKNQIYIEKFKKYIFKM